MVELGVRLLLGGVLAVAVVAKLAAPRSGQDALAGLGFGSPLARAIGFWSLIAVEAVLAVTIVAGSDEAAVAGAALMFGFALLMAGAIARGRAGEPCGCFGTQSKIGWTGVARNLLLGAGFVLVAALPSRELSTDQWLGLGLIAALLAGVGLAGAVLALAREIGLLRMRVGPTSALDIPNEGPEVGSRTQLAESLPELEMKGMGLAVFTSAGCHICEAMKPAIASIAAHPAVAVAKFDEVADQETWGALDVPGSPYAVAIDQQGTVLAKGTFNNLAQIESILATAERRLDGAPSVAHV